MKSSVYFVSLGCPKNLVDSQVMLGLLQKDRYTIAEEPKDAEVIIINTCAFIGDSKEESIETILEMAQMKENGRCQMLVVTGCLPQRYSAQMEKELPEVDLFIGTGQYHRITELLDTRNAEKKEGNLKTTRSYVNQPAFIHTEKDPRVLTGPAYSGYLKISEGCNRRCSFCIIPKLRGSVRSRSIASLVEETKRMAASGVKELNLVAQDLTEFGMEKKYQERIEELLPRLCRVEGIEWVRLHYIYPDDFSAELIDVIAREPKIVKYLDIPIQHTNDRILKSMNRRLTRTRLFGLIQKIRARIPEMVFRTSIIVGYPGETEEEFSQLCRDLAELSLDHVGVFSYSREEDTPAASMTGQIHAASKRRRLNKLTGQLAAQSLNRNQRYLGKTVRVLIEGPSEESELLLQGRMSTQAQEIDGHVLINDCPDTLPDPGQFVDVKITEALPHDLIGRVVRTGQ